MKPLKSVSSPPLSRKILRKVAVRGPNWAFTPRDFADLGDPRSVGMALTRLDRSGKIRRLGWGLYDRPHPHPILGLSGASTDAVVKALARGRRLRLLPSPQLASNQLGLSTQVPAKLVYHTDGAPTKIRLDNLEIIFRRNSGRLLALAGRASGVVAQALRDLGEENITPDVIRHLRTRLDDKSRRQIADDVHLVPAWMRPVFKELSSDGGH